MKPITLKQWKALAIVATIGVIVLAALHFWTWEVVLK